MSGSAPGEIGVIVPCAARRARILTLDGVELRRTSVDALKLSKVVAGASGTVNEIEQAIDGAEPEAAMNRALRLLGHRERSCRELADRLREDGYPDDLAGSVCDRLSTIGYLDDARFAEEYARSKRAAGWGRKRIADGLSRKGVDPDIAGAVLDSHVAVDAELDRASALIGTIDTSDRRGRERALRRLVSRGFAYETAHAALRRSGEHDPEA